MTVRRATAGDLPAVARIQQASPEAAQWDPESYLPYNLLIADCEGAIAGFVVSRTVAEGEHEILNLAVAPEFRRRGVGRALISECRLVVPGVIFLEVRASNRAARNFYKSLDFQEVGSRKEYYDSPPETAIVMKFHSC